MICGKKDGSETRIPETKCTGMRKPNYPRSEAQGTVLKTV
jgi:hypothetical protein